MHNLRSASSNVCEWLIQESGHMRAADLEAFLLKLKDPLGFNVTSSRKERLKLLLALEIPLQVLPCHRLI